MLLVAKCHQKVCKMMLKGKCVWSNPPFNAGGKMCPYLHYSPDEMILIECISSQEQGQRRRKCRFTAEQCPYKGHDEDEVL